VADVCDAYFSLNLDKALGLFLGWLISVPCFLVATAIILFRTVKGLKKLNVQKPPQNLIE
jgi:hypothetical protein